jgi:hypothetical protein
MEPFHLDLECLPRQPAIAFVADRAIAGRALPNDRFKFIDELLEFVHHRLDLGVVFLILLMLLSRLQPA